jgi:hypothetical protein
MGEWMYCSTILTMALGGGEWSASQPCRFIPGERAPGNHYVGGWVVPRAGLDAVEKRKILHCRESNPGRPARTPSLSPLRYPDSWYNSDPRLKYPIYEQGFWSVHMYQQNREMHMFSKNHKSNSNIETNYVYILFSHKGKLLWMFFVFFLHLVHTSDYQEFEM